MKPRGDVRELRRMVARQASTIADLTETAKRQSERIDWLNNALAREHVARMNAQVETANLLPKIAPAQEELKKANAQILTLTEALRRVLSELDGVAHNFRAAHVTHKRVINSLALHLARATNPPRDLGLEPEGLIYAYRSPATQAARRALGDPPDIDPREPAHAKQHRAYDESDEVPF